MLVSLGRAISLCSQRLVPGAVPLKFLLPLFTTIARTVVFQPSGVPEIYNAHGKGGAPIALWFVPSI